MNLKTSRQQLSRGGFTLVELLLVIAIISVLFALGAGGFMRVRQAQAINATEQTLNKLAAGFEQQWKAVVDAAKKEDIPAQVLAWAGNDTVRARTIWTKLRLRQEFPQNFAEATSPFILPIPNFAAAYRLPPKGSYVKKLTSIGSVPDAFVQSAICLAMAMGESRGGVVFDAGQLGPIANSTMPLVNNLPIFVDYWGRPVCFIRQPSGISLAHELNNPPFVRAGTLPNQRDPIDPEGSLVRAAPPWIGTPFSGSAFFNTNVHNIALNNSIHLAPVIFSAGPNEQPDFILNAPAFPFPATPATPNPPDVGAAPPDGMSVPTDNIYAYRLRRQGAKGDN